MSEASLMSSHQMERGHLDSRDSWLEVLKNAWSRTALRLELDRDTVRLFVRSGRCSKEDPFSEVLLYLLLQWEGMVCPPLSRCDPFACFGRYSVVQLCQLALLWAMAKQQEAASCLAASLPLEFPWIWCKEIDYSDMEAKASLFLLRKATAQLDGLQPVSNSSLFFQGLQERLVHFSLSNSPFFPVMILGENCLRAAVTCLGNQTSLGAISTPFATVRAFGPQGFLLSDSKNFGIRTIRCAQDDFHGAITFWASSFAFPEVWFKMISFYESKKIFLKFSFFGLKVAFPMYLTFYVQAPSARIGQDLLVLRSLSRYKGESKIVRFGENLCIEPQFEGKLEVIPLSGDACFWGCDYLAAFELHSINPNASFSIFLDS